MNKPLRRLCRSPWKDDEGFSAWGAIRGEEESTGRANSEADDEDSDDDDDDNDDDDEDDDDNDDDDDDEDSGEEDGKYGSAGGKGGEGEVGAVVSVEDLEKVDASGNTALDERLPTSSRECTSHVSFELPDTCAERATELDGEELSGLDE